MKKFTLFFIAIFIFTNLLNGQKINYENRLKCELITKNVLNYKKPTLDIELYKRNKIEENLEIFEEHWDNDNFNPYNGTILEHNKKFDLTNYSNPIHTNFVNSKFGKRGSRGHQGVDLKASMGDTIYAAFEGKIRMSKYNRSGYGFFIIIRHPNGLETLYGHLSRFLVKQNDIVKSGQPIGLAGNSGRSSAPHLHFEIRYNGKSMDPEDMIDFVNHTTKADVFSYDKRTARMKISS